MDIVAILIIDISDKEDVKSQKKQLGQSGSRRPDPSAPPLEEDFQVNRPEPYNTSQGARAKTARTTQPQLYPSLPLTGIKSKTKHQTKLGHSNFYLCFAYPDWFSKKKKKILEISVEKKVVCFLLNII